MPVYLHHIETAVPQTAYPQSFIAERMKRWAGKGDRKQERIISYLYSQSGIETRHSAVPDFVPGAERGIFYDGQTDTLRSPTTGERNELYTGEAKRLGAEVACNAFGGASGFDASEVTHIVTVSCTGFFQPGLDYHLVRTLNLPPSVPRFHLGFMGCYAAFPALRLAKTICETDPAAVVLVVSLELCSLHLRFDGDMDALIGGSVFADGAAAAIVSARQPAVGGSALLLERFDTTLTATGEGDMAWTIGDNGFAMRLSSYVPEILHANIADAMKPTLAGAGLRVGDISHWAVHPGGRAIVDKVRSALDLCEGSVAASRRVLKEYGNMSSATILFVLKEMLRSGTLTDSGEPIAAMAFGPGLTVESAVLRKA
ncbi:MAG: type III polyketide synthase [Akkermansiaceae bacterium]|nr:type III polyketide synthase [Armatimonadota bacterium]